MNDPRDRLNLSRVQTGTLRHQAIAMGDAFVDTDQFQLLLRDSDHTGDPHVHRHGQRITGDVSQGRAGPANSPPLLLDLWQRSTDK